MRTDDFRESDNVEDDRGQGPGRGGGLPGGTGGLGIGTVVVVLLVSWYFGINPAVLLNGAQILTGNGSQQTSPVPSSPSTSTAADPESRRFLARVLGDTEDRWTEIFAARGATYVPARLVLFTGGRDTPCTYARSAMGPFYCPSDQHIYLDTSFFDDLQNKFGGCSNSKACQFSEAYVVAHEVGHHVQDLIGDLGRMTNKQRVASNRAEANGLQVRVELQADCYAGVWAHTAQQKHNFLDPGDVDQALQTASAIGDDRLQKETQGYVVPDAFTHGTSEQRKRWFLSGFNQGTMAACNTLTAATL
jgi:predicted metalloprotease